MRLQLASAWLDELQIHDVTRINDPTLPYQLRSAKRARNVRRVEQPHTWRHGIVDQTKPLFTAQTFDLAGYVDAGTDLATENAYDALEAVLVREGSRTFRFRRLGRAEDEQAVVTLGGGPDPDETRGYRRTIKYAVTLVGADPRVYSATLKSASYDPTASLAGGGVAMPMPMPLVFSSTTATELYVTNQGGTKTPPIFTIRGPAVNPIIDNDTTVESLYLNTTLGAADTVIVDVAARTVTLNGAVRQDLFDASRSVWFELIAGENRLRLRGTGMVAGQTLFTAAYRDARV